MVKIEGCDGKMEFTKACSEISFILEHLDAKDKVKIPKGVIEFFKNNSDETYAVTLTPRKSLKEQNLLKETKAFLYLLHRNYFAKK